MDSKNEKKNATNFSLLTWYSRVGTLLRRTSYRTGSRQIGYRSTGRSGRQPWRHRPVHRRTSRWRDVRAPCTWRWFRTRSGQHRARRTGWLHRRGSMDNRDRRDSRRGTFPMSRSRRCDSLRLGRRLGRRRPDHSARWTDTDRRPSTAAGTRRSCRRSRWSSPWCRCRESARERRPRWATGKPGIQLGTSTERDGRPRRTGR